MPGDAEEGIEVEMLVATFGRFRPKWPSPGFSPSKSLISTAVIRTRRTCASPAPLSCVVCGLLCFFVVVRAWVPLTRSRHRRPCPGRRPSLSRSSSSTAPFGAGDAGAGAAAAAAGVGSVGGGPV